MLSQACNELNAPTSRSTGTYLEDAALGKRALTLDLHITHPRHGRSLSNPHTNGTLAHPRPFLLAFTRVCHLFLQADGETREYFRLIDDASAQPNTPAYQSKRVACLSALKSRVGLLLAKATAIRMSVGLGKPSYVATHATTRPRSR